MLERNKVYLGDAYELIKQVTDKSVDLIIVDPPYELQGKGKPSNNGISRSIYKLNLELEENELIDGIKEEILDDFMRVMKVPNIYIWCNKKQIPMYISFFVNNHGCNFDILLWNKPNAMPLYNNKYLTDAEYCLYFRKGGYCNPNTYNEAKTVFSTPINIRDKGYYHHPTVKPLRIIETLIKNSSKDGDLVFDCFLGSGTTAVACKNLNRDYIGIELNPKWYKVACDRLEGLNANGQRSFILK